MAISYETAGDTWGVYVGEDAPHPGVLPLIFHCTSNPSNGWRVVEVAESEFPAGASLEHLDRPTLAKLFERAQPFDYSHDPKSKENTVGETPLR